MDVDLVERDLASVEHAHDHHPRHPEREDVATRDERTGWIEGRQFRRGRGPAKRGVRPEGGREPGVEHVGIAHQRLPRHGLRAERLVRRADEPASGLVAPPGHRAAAGEGLSKVGLAHVDHVPDRNPVAPPELAAHGPITLLREPVEVALRVPLGHDPDPALRHGVERRLGEFIHTNEPLVGEVGLDGRLRAVGVSQFDHPVLHLHQLPSSLEITHDLVAGLLDREPLVGPRLGVERAFRVEDVDHRQRAAATDVVVVGIVGRRNLHAAGAHLGFGPLVSYERNGPAEERQADMPAGLRHRSERLEVREDVAATGREVIDGRVEIGVFLDRRCCSLFPKRGLGGVEGESRGGVNGHGGVAEERLGPRGGHRHALRLARLRIDDVVADVPEVALHLLVKHLVVANGGLQERVPVDEPLPATHEPFLEEPEERLADGCRALVVEREPGAIPVAARPEVTKLAEDPLLVLLLPGPDAAHQRLAAEVMAGEFFLLEEPPLYHGLRGDARVVRAGHPEGEEALHPPRADEHVLKRVVEGVAEVKRAGHVRRRDHNRVGRSPCLGLGVP